MWDNTHTSTTVRLPRPKPFAASTFLRDDDIVEKKEGGMKKGGDVKSGATILECGRDENSWRGQRFIQRQQVKR
jgi:hypothetical protein